MTSQSRYHVRYPLFNYQLPYMSSYTLNSIIKKEGEFTEFDMTDATKVGLTKFDENFQYMKENNTYWITSVLDPRIKTNWI